MKFPRLDIERKRNAISTELDIEKQIVFSKTIKKLQNRDILLIEVKSAEQGKKLLVTIIIAGKEIHVQELPPKKIYIL